VCIGDSWLLQVGDRWRVVGTNSIAARPLAPEGHPPLGSDHAGVPRTGAGRGGWVSRDKSVQLPVGLSAAGCAPAAEDVLDSVTDLVAGVGAGGPGHQELVVGGVLVADGGGDGEFERGRVE
jgi:hypothetical protein